MTTQITDVAIVYMMLYFLGGIILLLVLFTATNWFFGSEKRKNDAYNEIEELTITKVAEKLGLNLEQARVAKQSKNFRAELEKRAIEEFLNKKEQK